MYITTNPVNQELFKNFEAARIWSNNSVVAKDRVDISSAKTQVKKEKLIDLESGDKIEIKGTVFSTALGDPWVDVDEVKILEPKPAKKAS